MGQSTVPRPQLGAGNMDVTSGHRPKTVRDRQQRDRALIGHPRVSARRA